MASEASDLYARFGRNVDAGKIIFEEGEEGDQMFIIQAGRVKVSRTIDGKQQILAILEKGDFFGEMAIISRIKRTATVSALEPVKLLAFNREGFLDMINKNAKIALNVIDKLCRRLQRANQQIQHLARKDPKGLIAMNLSFAFQSAEASRGDLFLDRTVDEFSQNLDLTRDQVKAVLAAFAKKGVVSISANTLTLVDGKQLEALSEQFGA
jgi:CRP-like cAMP-binding protein